MFNKFDKVIFIYNNSMIEELGKHDGEIATISHIDIHDKDVPYLIEFKDGDRWWVTERDIIRYKFAPRELDIGKICDLL